MDVRGSVGTERNARANPNSKLPLKFKVSRGVLAADVCFLPRFSRLELTSRRKQGKHVLVLEGLEQELVGKEQARSQGLGPRAQMPVLPSHIQLP